MAEIRNNFNLFFLLWKTTPWVGVYVSFILFKSEIVADIHIGWFQYVDVPGTINYSWSKALH